MESARHRKLKELVSDLFPSPEWKVTVEASGPGWRADVLAEMGDRRVAVEVELSNPSINSITERHSRYLAEGIEAYWLVGRKQRGGKSNGDLPFFLLRGSDQDPQVEIGSGLVSLRTLLQAIAEERLPWQEPILDLENSASLCLLECECYRCGFLMTALGGVQEPLCVCGMSLDYPSQLAPWPFEREALKLIRSGALDKLPRKPMATLRRRGTQMHPAPYLANHCPYCGEIQGGYYVDGAAIRASLAGEGIWIPIQSERQFFPDVLQGADEHFCLLPRQMSLAAAA